ncbi:MAG: glucose-6-phosphate dehydrogenase, partial [Pseudomonadota bacterium]|nr:glucose-6-phosphate dehydrogenase [Pseudomonadota bacterium]
MVSRVIPVQPFDLVLFGATGDLARRKILPSLFHRFQIGQFSDDTRIIGSSRADLDRPEFQELTAAAIREFGQPGETNEADIAAFIKLLDYVAVDARGDGGWAELGQHLRADVTRAFYLSVAP